MNNQDEFDFVSNDTNLFENIRKRYLPYWPFFILFTLLSITGAFFYLRYTNPIYQTNARLLVQDDKKGVDASKVLDALDVFGEKKIVENEIEIIQSWPIMLNVVKKLHLYQKIFKIGKIRDVQLHGTNNPVTFVAINPDSLYFNINNYLYEFKIDFKLKNILYNNKVYKNNDTINFNKNSFTIHFNEKYIFNKNDNDYFYRILFSNPIDASKSFIKKIEVEPSSKQSTVINLSINDNVPSLSEDILNALIIEYQQAALLDKNKAATNTLSFIDKRLAEVVYDLNSIENEIKSYRITNGAINLSAQSTIFLESVKKVDEQISDINLKLAVLKDVENYILSKENVNGTVPSLMGINDPILNQLLLKLYENETLLKKQLQISGEKSTTVLSINQEIKDLKKDILESILNIKKSLTTTNRDLQTDLSKSNNILLDVPEKEKKLIQISREQAIKNSIYSFLLQKKEETSISYMSSVSDSRIIESATSNYSAISPKPNIIYLGSFAFGIFLGVFCVLILDIYNNKILFRHELEENTNLPIIGELMQGDNDNPIAIKDGDRSLIAEQIRSLRTNLSFFGIGGNKKVILVNSTISGEGKSFVAINIAASLALFGSKVAILELDLRKPKITKALLSNTGKGITNYLTSNANIHEIIQPADSVKLLDVYKLGQFLQTQLN
jgi:tyrosine-protein kinase Etk/Wzc